MSANHNGFFANSVPVPPVVSLVGEPSSSLANTVSETMIPCTLTLLEEELYMLSEHTNLLDFLLRTLRKHHTIVSTMITELRSAPQGVSPSVGPRSTSIPSTASSQSTVSGDTRLVHLSNQD